MLKSLYVFNLLHDQPAVSQCFSYLDAILKECSYRRALRTSPNKNGFSDFHFNTKRSNSKRFFLITQCMATASEAQGIVWRNAVIWLADNLYTQQLVFSFASLFMQIARVMPDWFPWEKFITV